MAKARQEHSNNERKESLAAELSKYQRFEVRRIGRAEIRNADYNPRRIDAEARKKLRKSLKDFGLVETLIWNEVTGNLVGGHQRLSILDELEGTPNYLLDVSVVHIQDPRKERTLNILLNNQNAQGEYEEDALVRLLTGDHAIPYEEAGLTINGMNILGVSTLPLEQESETEDEARKSFEKGKKHTKGQVKDFEKKNAGADSEFFLVVVFPNRIAVDHFLERHGLDPDTRYLSKETLDRLIFRQQPDAQYESPGGPPPAEVADYASAEVEDES